MIELIWYGHCKYAEPRLQMSVHRLLQRGFASLYGYTVAPAGHEAVETSITTRKSSEELTEFGDLELHSESMRSLHFKMKGASP